MGTKLVNIDLSKIGSVLAELEEAFFDIPFENSDFQNKAFVVAAQQTPARAYRAIGLRMFAKIRAVKEYEFGKLRTQIDLDEKQARLEAPDCGAFERRRLEVDIMQLNDARAWGEKLLNDSLRELNCLYAEFCKLPNFSREAFEAEEAAHFELKLTRQMTMSGAAESLTNMRQDLAELPLRANALKGLPNA